MKPIAIVGRYIPNSPTNVIDASITAGRGVGWFGLVEGAAPTASELENYRAIQPQLLSYEVPGRQPRLEAHCFEVSRP